MRELFIRFSYKEIVVLGGEVTREDWDVIKYFPVEGGSAKELLKEFERDMSDTFGEIDILNVSLV